MSDQPNAGNRPHDPQRPASGGSAGSEQDPTRAIPPTRGGPPGQDPTRAMPAVGGTPTGAAAPGEPRAWEASVDPRDTGAQDPYGQDPYGQDPYDDGEDVEQESERSRLRDWTLGLIGAVLGFAFAFIIIALSTGGDDPVVADDTDASAEQIASLEADVDERDARIDELEAQLAEAEAAAGDRDQDVAAQLEALEERTSALEVRAEALDDREAAIDVREQDVASREQAVADREAAVDEAPPPPPPSGEGEGDGGGIDLPDADDVENIVERVLERLRELF